MNLSFRLDKYSIFAGMFFLLSKILHFLLTPVIWIFGLLVIALWKRKSSGKKWIIIAITTLFIFGNSFIVDEFFRAYEVKATQIAPDEHFDYIIVLSGMIAWDQEYQRANFHGNIDRLLQSLPYYIEGIADTLILTGGDGTAFQVEAKESEVLINYLQSIDFPTERILVESSSRNTHENAQFTKNLLESRGIDFQSKKILLVTSALHMRRSLACFEKQGIHCIPYVTNRTSGPRKFIPDHLLIPNAPALHSWRALMHEWVGFVSYKIMGYI